MDAPLKEPPMFVSTAYRITRLHYTYRFLTICAAYVVKSIYRILWLHYTYGCATLSASFVSKNYLENQWPTQYL